MDPTEYVCMLVKEVLEVGGGREKQGAEMSYRHMSGTHLCHFW